MSPEEILSRLCPVVQEVFQDKFLMVTETLSMNEVPAWDSINHMTLIIAVEQMFKIQFSLTELVKVESIGDLMALIAAKETSS
ncbi:MAG: acyl carrier protein [Magnetococcus sp. YQC-5]